MGEEPERTPQPPPEGSETDAAVAEEVDDFITGHVLEKDTVFFEG